MHCDVCGDDHAKLLKAAKNIADRTYYEMVEIHERRRLYRRTNMEKVYVEKFVRFFNDGQGWAAYISDAPPLVKHWRVKIPVPDELLAVRVIEAQIEEPTKT